MREGKNYFRIWHLSFLILLTSLVYFQNADAAITVTGPARNCQTCHSAIVAKPSLEHHTTISSKIFGTNPSDCFYCHQGNISSCLSCHKTPHTAQHLTITAVECAPCHTPDVLNLHTIQKTYECNTCHENTAYSSVIYSDPNPDCSDCHGSLQTKHGSVPHRIKAVLECSTCHDTADIPGKTHKACTSCHGAVRVTSIITTLMANPDPNSAITCITCHPVGHIFKEIHSISETAGCGSCHTLLDTTLAGIEAVHNTPTNGSGSCATCHGSSRADVREFIDNRTAVSCSNCHESHIFDQIHSISDAGCASCHELLDGTVAAIETLHTVSTNGPGSCATCHNSSRPEVGAAIAARAAVTCSACHTGHEGSGETDHNNLGIPENCAVCHGIATKGFSFRYVSDIHTITAGKSSCTTCHSSSDPAILAVISSGKGTSGTPLTCLNCHTNKHVPVIEPPSNIHGVFRLDSGTSCFICHASRTLDSHWNMTTSASCSGCHASNNQDAINALHKKDCIKCHLSTRPEVLSVITSHKPMNCESCHNGGHVFNQIHSIIDNGCTSCHPVPDLNAIEVIHNVATNGAGSCATCHASNRPEVVAAIKARAEVSCTGCHTAHSATDHNNLVATGTCAICHTSKTSGTDFSYIVTYHPPLAIYGGTQLKRCQTCHSSTRPEVVNTIAKGKGPSGSEVGCTDCHTAAHVAITGPHLIHNNILVNVGGECSKCHTSGDDTHGDMITVSPCTGCHASGNQNAINALHRNSCTFCHLSDRPEVLTAIKSGIGGTKITCVTCHGDAGHSIENHLISESTGCATCHRKLNGSKASLEAIHNVPTNGQGACSTCHASTRPEVIAAIKTRAPITCSACHTPHDNGLEADHNNLKIPATCAVCHTLSNSGFSFTYINTVHQVTTPYSTTSCFTCHDSPNQAVKNAIASGRGSAGTPLTCLACHQGQHVSVTTNTSVHTVFHVEVSSSCLNCHAPWTLDSHHNMKTSVSCSGCHPSVDQNAINSLHRNNCMICHLSNRPEVIASIRAKAPLTCNSCHPQNHDFAPVHQISETPGCRACHTQLDSTVASIETIHDTTTNGIGSCATCHGSNRPEVMAAILARAPVDCTACHQPHDPTHALIKLPLSENCLNCHNTNAETEHIEIRNIGCVDCHSSTNQNVLNAIAAGLAGNIVNCANCHTAGINHTSEHDQTFVPTLGCRDCHADNVAIEHIDKRPGRTPPFTCLFCHNATFKAIIDKGINGQPVLCTECHFLFVDHSNAHDKTGADESRCITCHDQDAATEHVTNRNHSCLICHGSAVSPEISAQVSLGKKGTMILCSDCHGATDHSTAHNHALGNSGNCIDCHSANVVTEHVDIRLLTCATCHESANQAVQDTIDAGSGVSGIDVYCSDCHAGSGSHATDHDFVGLPANPAYPCTDCHNPNVVAEHVDNHGLTCQTCHHDGNAAIISAGMNSIYQACSACHGASDHVDEHNMTSLPASECAECHAGNVATEHVGRTSKTGLLVTCVSCHNNSAYDAIIQDGRDGQEILCTGCHSIINHTPPTSDAITSIRAQWSSRRSGRLEVFAVNTQTSKAQLIVEYCATTYPMIWSSTKGQWELTISPSSFCSTVKVTSSLGGSATSRVRRR